VESPVVIGALAVVECSQCNLTRGALIELAAQTARLETRAGSNMDLETLEDPRAGDTHRVAVAAGANPAVLSGRKGRRIGKVACILCFVKPRKHTAPSTLVAQLLLEDVEEVAMPGEEDASLVDNADLLCVHPCEILITVLRVGILARRWLANKTLDGIQVRILLRAA